MLTERSNDSNFDTERTLIRTIGSGQAASNQFNYMKRSQAKKFGPVMPFSQEYFRPPSSKKSEEKRENLSRNGNSSVKKEDGLHERDNFNDSIFFF